jgi:hypothetical protein
LYGQNHGIRFRNEDSLDLAPEDRPREADPSPFSEDILNIRNTSGSQSHG